MPSARSWKTKILAWVLVLVWLGCPWAVRADEPGPFTLRVLHVNDTHSHLEPTEMALLLGGEKVLVRDGGYPALIARVKAVRGQERGPLLLLHAGDAVQGTLYYSKYLGQADMALLNLLGIEAMAVGNHEFDLGPGQLARLVDLAAFPLLSANVDATREPALVGKIKPAIIREIQGQKVGILGLTTTLTPGISSPGPNVSFEDQVAAADRAVKALTSQGVDKIIALTHLGYDQDLELASRVPGLDLVVGGHSHTRLDGFEAQGLAGDGPYPTKISGADGQTVCVVQAWEWGKILGDVTVTFDAKGQVTDCVGRPVMLLSGEYRAGELRAEDPAGAKKVLAGQRLAGVERAVAASPNLVRVQEDPEALALLAPYRQGLEQFRRQTVALAEEDLTREKELAGRTRQHPVKPEEIRGVGALTAEAMLWKMNHMGLGVAMAFHNRGGCRIDIPRGNVTMAQINELLPFGNTLFLATLKGVDIRQILAQGLAGGRAELLCLAGIRVRTEAAGASGFVLVSAEVRQEETWVPLDDPAEYRVVLNSYLARGGDGYALFKERGVSLTDTGFGDVEAFAEYATARKRLAISTDPAFLPPLR